MVELKNKIDQDPYLNFLGIKLDELSEGSAVCSLTIKENMINFLGVPHGGLIFSLADAALSAASNSDHFPSFARNIDGSFLSKVNVGDQLRSKCERVHQTYKTGLYRMEIFHHEDLISIFHGTVYRSRS